MFTAECHLAIRPHGCLSADCGDTGLIIRFDNQVFLALVDVLGKGKEACQVALLAKEYLEQNCPSEPADILKGLHGCLKGGRGAVAAVCCFDGATGLLRCAGIGNITVRIFGARRCRFVWRDGIIGYIMPAPREQTAVLTGGDVLIMHSDGVKEHVEEYQIRSLLSGNAEFIATEMIHKFGKSEDDASCIALRCQND